MRRRHDRARRFGRPAVTRCTARGRRVGSVARNETRQWPDTAPGPLRDRARYVRFIPSEIPVLTCEPPGHPAALHGAATALARLGRPDLGGLLQVRAAGAAPDAVRLAAGRAVENALRGGSGNVTLPPAGTRWTGTDDSEDWR